MESKITTLSTNDVAKIKSSCNITLNSLTSEYAKTSVLPHTLDECKELYLKAEEIADLAKQTIKDGLQGRALLEAKKMICGDEWNAKKMSKYGEKKWSIFLQSIDLLEKSGKPKRNVNYLLDFAGYKEVEERLIESGEDIEPIQTASHYREVKKIANTPEDVAKTYTEVVKSNGEKPKTANDVRAALAESYEQLPAGVYFEKIVAPELGVEQPDVEGGAFSHAVFSQKVVEKLPEIDTWKEAYKKLATMLHPDKGGDEFLMEVIMRINDVYKDISKFQNAMVKREEYAKAFRDWKKNNDIGHFVKL